MVRDADSEVVCGEVVCYAPGDADLGGSFDADGPFRRQVTGFLIVAVKEGIAIAPLAKKNCNAH